MKGVCEHGGAILSDNLALVNGWVDQGDGRERRSKAAPREDGAQVGAQRQCREWVD